MIKSKTRIEKQLNSKRNPELVETIILAKKNPAWIEIASILSKPSRNRTQLNLERINKESKEGEIIVVPGKILSVGEIDKKIKLVALNFSEKAKEKLQKAGCTIESLLEEIKKNKEAKNIKILKWK